MITVFVRGVDGNRSEVALVRRENGIVYVCAKHRYAQASKGDDGAVVGFREADVEWPAADIPKQTVN